jgi:hypothetical protein
MCVIYFEQSKDRKEKRKLGLDIVVIVAGVDADRVKKGQRKDKR